MTMSNAAIRELAVDDGLPQSRPARPRRSRAENLEIVGRYGVLPPLVIFLLASALFVPNFLSGANIANVLSNTSILAVIGCGMTIVIALRGLDLAVGATQGLTACIVALVAVEFGSLAGVGAGLLAGVLVGLANGILIAYVRIPAFVASLAIMGIARGAALLVAGGGSIGMPSGWFTEFGTASVLGVPVLFLVALAIILATYVLINRVPFGRYVLAVGGSPEAASDNGIRVRRVTLLAYLLCGLTASIGGIMLVSQIGSASGALGQGLELQVIAIAVLGGTTLAGGTANIPGTLCAALLLSSITAALNLLNVPSFYQYLAVGGVLLLALGADSFRRRLQKAALANG